MAEGRAFRFMPVPDRKCESTELWCDGSLKSSRFVGSMFDAFTSGQLEISSLLFVAKPSTPVACDPRAVFLLPPPSLIRPRTLRNTLLDEARGRLRSLAA
jgi:hypothetical protein